MKITTKEQFRNLPVGALLSNKHYCVVVVSPNTIVGTHLDERNLPDRFYGRWHIPYTFNATKEELARYQFVRIA
jgi:hypothetical protein